MSLGCAECLSLTPVFKALNARSWFSQALLAVGAWARGRHLANQDISGALDQKLLHIDSRDSTLMVAATSGFQELQGCSDLGRQGPEEVVSVMPEAVSMFTKSSSGAAVAWAGSVCTTGCISVAVPPFMPACFISFVVLSPGHSVSSPTAFQHIFFFCLSQLLSVACS